MGKGRKYRKTNRTKITTKNAISKAELRAARKKEEEEINKAISSKREIKNSQNNVVEEVQEMPAVVEEKQFSNEEIYNLFENDRKSISQISKECKIAKEEILTMLVCSEYQNKETTIIKLSEKFGVTSYRIRKILTDNNIQMNKPGLRRKKVEEIEEIEAPTIKITVTDNATSEETVAVEESISEEPDEVEEIKEAAEPADIPKPQNSILRFCEQEIRNDKLRLVEFSKYSNDVIVAGLCRNRHDMPVRRYIFDTLNEKELADPKYTEARALGFINAWVKPMPTMPAKTLVLYCTGLQLALSAVVSVCAQNKVNLITMHYNPNTDSYVPQNTLTIFGKPVNIEDISPLKNLEERYHGGVFTYGCKVKNLVEREKCMYISLHNDYLPEENSIILFDHEFPTDEIWKFYGELIKASRIDGIRKRHTIQMGNINVSLSGYIINEIALTRSRNYKNEKSSTTRIIM